MSDIRPGRRPGKFEARLTPPPGKVTRLQPAEPFGELEGPLAETLAGISSVDEDIEFARRCLAALRMILLTSTEGSQETVRIALWNAAVTAYGRCYAKTRQQRRREAPLIPMERVSMHNALMTLRNAHIAHVGRASKTELTFPLAQLAPPGSAPSIVDVAVSGIKQSGPSGQELYEAEMYLAWVADRVVELETAARDRLRAALATMPIDVLYDHAARKKRLRT